MNPSILVIEDSDEDFTAIEWALGKIGRTLDLRRCLDGDEALDYLQSAGRPWPALVLLDLNLPGTDGREVLISLKGDAALRTLPVVVMTTSANPRDVESCYQQGANSYLLKPVDFAAFVEQVRLLTGFWLDAVELPAPPQGRAW